MDKGGFSRVHVSDVGQTLTATVHDRVGVVDVGAVESFLGCCCFQAAAAGPVKATSL